MSIDLNVALRGLPGIPRLRGRLTRLRAVCAADAGALFRLYADPRVAHHGARAPMSDAVEAVGLVTEMQADFQRRERLAWVVTGARDDLAIGTCTLFHFDARHARAEVGYALDADHWGRGLGSDAVSAALDWSQRMLGLHTIRADVEVANLRSQALLGRLGFQPMAAVEDDDARPGTLKAFVREAKTSPP